MISPPQYLFICGCARSGTTTLADLLRSHNKMAMGRERYAVRFRLRKPIDASLFERERFCHRLEEGDTHHHSLNNYYLELYSRFDQCTHIGDKIPKIYEDYDFWRKAFPGAKFIFLLRNPFDVAQSFEKRAEITKKNGGLWPADRDYQNAIEEWNLSLGNTIAELANKDIFVLEYESLYLNDALLSQLFSFMGLPVDNAVNDFWQKAASVRRNLEASRVITLDSIQKRYIARNAHFDLYRQLTDEAYRRIN